MRYKTTPRVQHFSALVYGIMIYIHSRFSAYNVRLHLQCTVSYMFGSIGHQGSNNYNDAIVRN